jgi:hypothetical protein
MLLFPFPVYINSLCVRKRERSKSAAKNMNKENYNFQAGGEGSEQRCCHSATSTLRINYTRKHERKSNIQMSYVESTDASKQQSKRMN